MIFLYITHLLVSIAFFGILFYYIREANKPSPDVFLDQLSILSTLIKTELNMFDKSVFEEKGAMTNSNYDNYYKELTTRIINNIPDTLIDSMSAYYTRDAIYKIIARSVQLYLVDKIQGNS